MIYALCAVGMVFAIIGLMSAKNDWINIVYNSVILILFFVLMLLFGR